MELVPDDPGEVEGQLICVQVKQLILEWNREEEYDDGC